MSTVSLSKKELPTISIGRHCCSDATNLDNYRPLVGDELIDEIHLLSRELNGVKVCQINATAGGGGVAELLARQIPIYHSLGINTDWRLIHGDKEFFTVTKGFHNALQGANYDLTPTIKEEYIAHNRASAKLLEDSYDVLIVHDPQPAAMRHFHSDSKRKWIWRCHIDSSQPNKEVWQFLKPYIEKYDAAVFTMEDFCPSDLKMSNVLYIPPAIDPLATKNTEIPLDLCRRTIADSGINLKAPILLQVSRFDPWKDPLGVIQAYQMVKEHQSDVQLVLVGAMAGDDPEGWEILDKINAAAMKDRDIYVFTNMTGVGNMEVNVFQRGADVIIQKSLREGFGLVVSEAFWKGKAVVAGAAGGIPMQFPQGYDKYLVNSVDECAERLKNLLDHPDAAAKFGQAGKERIRREFLLPRLIRDELKLIKNVLKS